jgi:hypothetical protein
MIRIRRTISASRSHHRSLRFHDGIGETLATELDLSATTEHIDSHEELCPAQFRDDIKQFLDGESSALLKSIQNDLVRLDSLA